MPLRASLLCVSKMAVPSSVSISDFLALAKSGLAQAIRERSNVTIVTGNQSADLDSMTSAILYAYARSQAPPAVAAFTPLYVPLLNVPAADVALRPEFHAAFRHAHVAPADLVTLDDLPPADRLRDDLPPENTRWILVDHNRLEGALGAVYGDRVHGVIDHHAEENAVPKDTAPEPRVIEDCGSCTSLVLRTLLGTPMAGSSDVASVSYTSAQAAALPGGAAKLALASILVDTRNLENPEKVRPTDVAVAQFLAGKAEAEDKGWSQEKYFKEVHKAKKDIEDLPLQGILRKDYKQFSDAGIETGMSTVVKPLDFLVDKAKDEAKGKGDGKKKEAWNRAAAEFVEARKLGIWVIGTTFSEKGDDEKQSRRQLCVQYKDGGPEAKAVERFEKASGQELQLEEIEVKGISAEGLNGYKRKVWNQGDVSKSRKQVAPLLRAAITGG